jgi:glyoxylase-like metal-dependent hydrolase (beta-lactamase superfamily II)
MAEQVADGVWLLDLGLVPPLATNAYVVDDTLDDEDGDGASDGDAGERGVTLVDTGLFWNRDPIRVELADAGYEVADIDRVLLTHYDLDHTTGLHRIAEDLSAPVYLGADDAALVAGETDPSALHHKGLFHRFARRVAPLPDGVAVEPITDGDRIGRFRAYHTPGHNPGHTVYVHEDGPAFLGDLVWEDDGGFTPPFWLDSYDVAELRASIRSFADRCDEFEVACMGHGDPLRAGGSAALEELLERL